MKKKEKSNIKKWMLDEVNGRYIQYKERLLSRRFTNEDVDGFERMAVLKNSKILDPAIEKTFAAEFKAELKKIKFLNPPSTKLTIPKNKVSKQILLIK